MTPKEVEDGKIPKPFKRKKQAIKENTDIRVGDRVRIRLDTKQQTKEKERWSRTIYRVRMVLKPRKTSTATQFLLRKGKENVKERFFVTDLLKIPGNTVVKAKEEKFKITKLVEPKVIDGKRFFRVRWRGFRPEDDTFEPREALLEDVPKLVRAFERKRKVRWQKDGVLFE